MHFTSFQNKFFKTIFPKTSFLEHEMNSFFPFVLSLVQFFAAAMVVMFCSEEYNMGVQLVIIGVQEEEEEKTKYG